VNSFERSLLEGRLSHAYLFVGPKHVGKMTLALDLARALNCKSAHRPCGECPSCRRITESRHSDVLVIRLAPAEDADEPVSTKAIGVDQIREMQRAISLKPYEGGYRVVIIDGADHMSDGAANSLLKTLEEPPSDTVLVLLAVDEGSLLSTIVSRCQRLELRPLPAAQVERALIERKGISPERARLLARLCRGCIGWAMEATKDESVLEERTENLSSLIALAGADISGRFKFAAELAEEFGKSRTAVRERLELWLDWWRDVMLMKGGCSDFVANVDREGELRHHAEYLNMSAVGETIKSIRAAMRRLDQNANPRLVLEVLMLSIPSIPKEREMTYA